MTAAMLVEDVQDAPTHETNSPRERQERMTIEFPGQSPKSGIITWATNKRSGPAHLVDVWADGTKVTYSPLEGD